jgi:hypothetical protein
LAELCAAHIACRDDRETVGRVEQSDNLTAVIELKLEILLDSPSRLPPSILVSAAVVIHLLECFRW